MNFDQLMILLQGKDAWNTWRRANPSEKVVLDEVYLSGADLREVDLRGANLRDADLREVVLFRADLRGANLDYADLSGAVLVSTDLMGANLSGADLSGANLSGARFEEALLIEAYLPKANLGKVNLRGATLVSTDLSEADLSEADLRGADLRRADLRGADLRWAVLSGATLVSTDLREVDLREADLEEAILVRTNLEGSDLRGCRVYGTSAWDINLTGARQADLIITPKYTPEIRVDNLQVAQFIYLLLNNAEVRDVIDTITSKAVLILGRFTDERKAVLDALREELRKRNYLPIVFDFEKPVSRDLDETVGTLARMSRFIIADITDAKSVPQELRGIVPDLPSVPVKPIILRGQHEWAMFEYFKRYPWVLELHEYDDIPQLLGVLVEQIITPAEKKAFELRPKA